MSLAALINLGGGEVLPILALFLVLLGVARLREPRDGFWQGIEEFWKATREATEELPRQEVDNTRPNDPLLLALIFILGATILIFVVYELSK